MSEDTPENICYLSLTKQKGVMSYDEEYVSLLNHSKQMEHAMEQEADNIKTYISQHGKNIAVISGVLLGSYLLARMVTKSSRKKIDQISHKSESLMPLVHVVPKSNTLISDKIKQAIALFIISIAKQKLKDFIENQSKVRAKGSL